MANDRRFPWVKWLVILLLLSGGAAAGIWYYKRQQDTPSEYQTAQVTRGELTQVVTATGQLNPVVNVQVGSQISGIIRKLYVDYNSVVKSNQVIAEVDPSTYQISVMRAEADVANAKANLALAKVQADRAEALFASKLISGSDHDTAKAQFQQAEAALQSAEATLKNAKVQLSYCTIYAPVDGVVISRNVDVGQTVAASFNTPTVFVIANDLTKMQIDALVSEADIGGVAVKQPVNFTVDAYPYRTFRGQVSQVRYGAITNQNVINYDCVIEVNNSDLKLLPGMTANVSIIVAERDNALKIPNAALRYRPLEATAGETRTNGTMVAASAAGRAGGEGGGRGMRPGGGGGGAGGGGPTGVGPAGERRGERGGGGSGEGGGRRLRGDRQQVRTVYVLPAKPDPKDLATAKPTPVQIKVGISDGVATEVLEGLEEGQKVVTALLSAGESSAAGRPGGPANPFGGGPFRRF
jgi:HlyD family secretion protein